MQSGTGREELFAGLLLDPAVLEEPYAFFRRLVSEAPVWKVPGSQVVVVTSFDAVTEATNRVGEFSSHLRGVLYRDETGEPGVFPMDMGPEADVLAVADPPAHARHRSAVFPELVARQMVGLR